MEINFIQTILLSILSNPFITFLLGLISGVTIQTINFHLSKIKDNWNDLKNPLEEIYETIKTLLSLSSFLLNTQNDNSLPIVNKINRHLTRYHSWYQEQSNKGQFKKLDSIDEELSATFQGISYFSLYSQDDSNYVRVRNYVFNEQLLFCNKKLDNYLKGKTPYFIIYHRKKLKNWRDGRF